jgi:serine/threonine protein kinase
MVESLLRDLGQQGALSADAANATAQGDDAASAILSLVAPAADSGELGRLGSYRLLRVLGVGGMGVVFEALDSELNRKVALKIIRPALTANHEARQRFLREAQAAAKLEHPHIVAIHHVGQQRGLPYLAMQRLQGETLDERLRRCGPLAPQQVLKCGLQIASALEVAHQNGIVHRDIKPSNIFLVDDAASVGECHIKLLDFGLVHMVEDDQGLTAEGSVAGTPAFMSPEQARGTKVDARSDLFSFGCVLYAAASGRSPFDKRWRTPTIQSVLEDEPPPLDHVVPKATAGLVAIVHRLLNKSPDQRYQTADEVKSALAKEVQLAQSSRLSRIVMRRGLIAGVAVLLLASIIYLNTGKGTLILEINQPDVAVTIDGDKIDLHSPRDRIKLTVGAHDLEVSKDGFTTHTQEFTIHRGEKKEIGVRLVLTPDESADEQSEPVVHELAISAKDALKGTGINVPVGSRLLIRAGGAIDGTFADDHREYYHDVPPEGRAERFDYFPYPTLPGLALVGRIGNGPVFYVGSQFELQVRVEHGVGELFLGINDDVTDDNEGEWKVDVTVKEQQP